MAHNVFEYCTDPHTMSEMTGDTAPSPEDIIEMCEEEGIDLNQLLEDNEMTKKDANTRTDTSTPSEVDSKLPALNDKPANCIGVLHMTPSMHAHLQNEAERLRKAQASNLWWIASFYGEYGVQPSIEDVFHTAPAIAEDVDSFIFDKQATPDGYDDQSGRVPRTTNQYRSIEDNARKLLENQAVIKTLKEAGYIADHLTARELYESMAEQARKRAMERKAKEDFNNRVAKDKLEVATKAASSRYDFQI